MFKDGYHIAHCQSTGNIFRYNPVQKPKIRLPSEHERDRLWDALPGLSLWFHPKKKLVGEGGKKIPYVGYVLCRYGNKPYRTLWLSYKSQNGQRL